MARDLVGDKLGKEIADALGLKHCRMINIHLEHDRIAIVTAEFYPEIDGVKQFPPILKKFNLVAIEEEECKLSSTP